MKLLCVDGQYRRSNFTKVVFASNVTRRIISQYLGGGDDDDDESGDGDKLTSGLQAANKISFHSQRFSFKSPLSFAHIINIKRRQHNTIFIIEFIQRYKKLGGRNQE
jgi:hypothetical protein